ncbi:MAG: TonB-dependent receptor plug [Sphingobacteriales bacterium]|nr:TonB-dependent receptor plug [Sphingobacteriales bacterium]
MEKISKGVHSLHNLKFLITKSLKLFTMALIISAFTLTAFSQTIQITGTVTDESGGTLPGVSVRVKGSQTGTITDNQGAYAITVPSEQSSLVYTYIGFEVQEVVLRASKVINIILKGQTNSLNEVVVIGYGFSRKKELVGAVNVVSARDAGGTTATNPSALLIGKVAGLQVVQANGSPGADAQIIIRGTGSFKNIDPLYVIDGIQGSKTLFNTLSSHDIENITVLKDASSTAIYGSAAANGVVIITTKKPQSGAPRISFTSQWGTGNAWKQLDILNATQYVDLLKDYSVTNNSILPAKFSSPDVLVDNTDWQKAIFKQALSSENQVNVSGGSEKLTYTFSMGFIKQEAIVTNLKNDRLNARLGLEETLGRFKFGQFLNMRHDNSKGVMSSITNAIQYAPYKPIYDPSILGGFSNVTNALDGSDINNPLMDPGVRSASSKSFVFFPQFYGEVSLINGLKFRSQIAGQIQGSLSRGYNYSYAGANGIGAPRQGTLAYSNTSFYNLENYFSYNKDIRKHGFSAIAGTSYLTPGNTTNLSASGSGQLNDNIQSISLGGTRAVTGGSENWARPSLISYYGRLNYTYNKKYIINSSFRRDGASNFGEDSRWGNFMGIGSAWRFKEESFVQDNLKFISDGKLRIGWGRTGNNSIGNFLTSPLTYAGSPVGNVVYSLGTNEQFVSGVTVNALASPDLRWEQTDQTDIGMDLSFLDNKFTVSVDWYDRKSNGLLVSVPVPASVGIGLTQGVNSNKVVNAANAQNKGWEFSLGYNEKLNKNTSFTVSANASFNKNEVLSLGNEFAAPIMAGSFNNLSTFTLTNTGGPIGAYYGYRMSHVASTQAEIDALNSKAAAKTGNPATIYQAVLKPGDFIFNDINGDGVVTSADQEVLGSPMPKIVYGFNAGLNFKTFDLNLVISGISDMKLLNATKLQTQIVQTRHNASTAILDRWRQPGDVASLPRAGQNATSSGNLRASDWWLEDGSYLRLRNITLGYTLPESMLNRMAGKVFGKVRVYMAAENLLTITNYSGYDPEVSGANFIFDRGIDRGQVPQSRVFLAGIELGF